MPISSSRVRRAASRDPRSLDEFLDRVEACDTTDTLFSLMEDETQREGYHNVIFARIYGSPDRLEVPFGNVPEGDARLYFENRMWEHDPILAATQTTSLPFTWIDVMMRRAHSEQAHRVMELSAAMGVQGGLTMPFHGPAGQWDVISVSMKDKSLLDPNRINILNMKAFAVVQRYRELVSPLGTPIAHPHEPAEPHQHPQHGTSVGEICNEDCRVLVLVDISWRRYHAGLIDLNRRLPAIVGQVPLDRYLHRGLIEEEPDDLRFHYVFKPTAIARSHLKLCPHVSNYREEVWRSHVHVHERPQD